MIPTSFTTTVSRCCHSLVSKALTNHSAGSLNPKSAFRAVQHKSNPERFDGSVWMCRRHASTSAAQAQRSVRLEGTETQPLEEERESSTRENHSAASNKRLKSDLRALLRDIAQPVAVVTSFMPSPNLRTHPSSSATEKAERIDYSDNGSLYHGATLSSFTSIAMDPYPLVSFALRIPSRMASALASLSQPSSSSSPSSAHMVINLLSSSQALTALTFSRPDLYPTPFLGSSSSSSSSLSDGVPYTLSQDGLPVLNDVIGALSCQLLGGPIPLHDLEYLSKRNGDPPSVPVLRPGEVASELFIARVVRVEEVKRERKLEEGERTLQPLIYHRRGYTSCRSDPDS